MSSAEGLERDVLRLGPAPATRLSRARLVERRRCGRRGPACEEVESLLGSGPGFGREDGDGETVVGAELHGLVAKIQVADDRVMDVLSAGAVEADVVCGPADAELVAAR